MNNLDQSKFYLRPRALTGSLTTPSATLCKLRLPLIPVSDGAGVVDAVAKA